MTKNLNLEPLWEAHGAVFKDLDGWKVPTQFCDPAKEFEQVTNHAGVMDVSHRSLVCVRGGDRIEVLNNILTNDIKSLKAGEACRAFLLVPQGKILLDLNVFVFEQEVWLETEASLEEKVIERLGRFVITEDVVFETKTDDFVKLLVTGKFIANKFSSVFSYMVFPEENYKFSMTPFPGGEAVCVKVPNYVNPSYELILPKAFGSSVVEKLLNPALQVFAFGLKVYEELRVLSGQLKFGVDMDENTLLSETALDKTCVSWTKGCYPGQEVIAKIDAYKGLKRKACRFILDQNPSISAGERIKDELGKDVGWVTSVTYLTSPQESIGYIAIDYIDESHWNTLVVGKSGRIKEITSLNA